MTDKNRDVKISPTVVIETQTFDLDKVLKEIGPGFRALIKRKEPSWCDGIVDTIELDPDEPLSMDKLRREYGGRKLQIIVHDANGDYVTSRTVKFPDPPRYEGREIHRDTGQQPQAQAQQSNALAEMTTIFKLMMDSQERQTNSMVNAMDRRLDVLERGKPGTAITPSQKAEKPLSHVKESLATIKAIEDLKKEMGLDKPDSPSAGESTVSRAVEQFTDLLVKKEEAKIERDIKASQTKTAAPGLPPASTYTPPPENGRASAAQAVENLTDLEFAAHAKRRLEGMDEQQRERLLDAVLGEEEEEETEETGTKSSDDVRSSSSQVQVIEDNEDEDTDVDKEISNAQSESHSVHG